MVDILIPSCQKRDCLEEQIQEATKTAGIEHRFVLSGFRVSASTNRNYTLNRATSDIVIMMDDDICGFREGWAAKMVDLLDDPSVVMVSARLLAPDGTPGLMVGENYNMTDPVVEVAQKQLPTACIAFRNDGLRFDEVYIGSGFEDNDFCHQIRMRNPEGHFVICNRVKVIHKNDMKNQKGKYWEHNLAYYKAKWGFR